MDIRELESLNFGPHTETVLANLRSLNETELLRFGGVLLDSYKLVPTFESAMARMGLRDEDGLDWIGIRDIASAYSNGGGGFLHDEPWVTNAASIRQVYRWLDEFVQATIPSMYQQIADDAYADLRSCVDCLLFHGGFDSFHSILWEAYRQGGWPCGWSGSIEETEDGSLVCDSASIAVFWQEGMEDASS